MGLRVFVPLVVGVLVGVTSAAAAPERVTVAVASRDSVGYVPLEVAHALGYFSEQGLDVELQYFTSGTLSATALLSGTVDFSANAFDHAVKAALKGRPLTAIAAFTEVPGVELLVGTRHRSAVRDPADLKGRPVAVSGPGAYTHLILAYVLARNGVKSDEIRAVPVGSDGVPAALENDRVHGAVAVGAQAAKLVETGRAFVLLDLRSRAASDRLFGAPYLTTGLLTRPGVCTEKAEVCLKLSRGIVKAIRWLDGRPSAEVAAALPATLVPDSRLYAATFDENREGFSRTGRIDPRAVETVLGTYRTTGALPDGQKIDPTVLYDNRFVDRALAELR